jgi:hypothetical protein
MFTFELAIAMLLIPSSLSFIKNHNMVWRNGLGRCLRVRFGEKMHIFNECLSVSTRFERTKLFDTMAIITKKRLKYVDKGSISGHKTQGVSIGTTTEGKVETYQGLTRSRNASDKADYESVLGTRILYASFYIFRKLIDIVTSRAGMGDFPNREA